MIQLPDWWPYVVAAVVPVIVALVTGWFNWKQKTRESDRPTWDGMAGQVEKTRLEMEKLQKAFDEERTWRRRLEDDIEKLRDHIHDSDREQARFCRETVEFVDALLIWVLADHRGGKPNLPPHLQNVNRLLWDRLDALRTETGPADDGQPDDITRRD